MLDEERIPKDRRLLLIGTPRQLPMANVAPDAVVGRWNASRSAFVQRADARRLVGVTPINERPPASGPLSDWDMLDDWTIATIRLTANSIIRAHRVGDHLSSLPLTHMSTNSSIAVV